MQPTCRHRGGYRTRSCPFAAPAIRASRLRESADTPSSPGDTTVLVKSDATQPGWADAHRPRYPYASASSSTSPRNPSWSWILRIGNLVQPPSARVNSSHALGRNIPLPPTTFNMSRPILYRGGSEPFGVSCRTTGTGVPT